MTRRRRACSALWSACGGAGRRGIAFLAFRMSSTSRHDPYRTTAPAIAGAVRGGAYFLPPGGFDVSTVNGTVCRQVPPQLLETTVARCVPGPIALPVTKQWYGTPASGLIWVQSIAPSTKRSAREALAAEKARSKRVDWVPAAGATASWQAGGL